MFTQEAAHRSGKCAKDYKDDAEAGNETKCPGQRLAHTALSSAREVRNVDGQHGQEARRNEGNDPFKKSYDILHSLHSFRMCRCSYRIIFCSLIIYSDILMMNLSFMRHLGLHFAVAAFPAKNP